MFNREDSSAIFLASACLIRPGISIHATLTWALSTATELGQVPPLGVIADVGTVFNGTQLTQHLIGTPKLKKAIQAYDDHVMGRIASEAKTESVVDAMSKLSIGLKNTGVSFIIGKIVERLGGSGILLDVSITEIKKMLRISEEDIKVNAFAELRSPRMAEKLATIYEGIAKAARHTGCLVADSDIFTMENLGVLSQLNQRIAIEHIVDAAQEIEASLPQKIRRKAQSTGPVPTQADDESNYPIGGFSAISNSGTIENLVCSELIYMEDPKDLEESGDQFDMFDMRYAEGELLYYTRDESMYVRRAKVVTFVLNADLIEARVKDRGVKYQRLVIALGAILCTIKRMISWLSEDGMIFRIIFLNNGKRQALLFEEIALSKLLFREWQESGVVVISEATSIDSVLESMVQDVKKFQCHIVEVSTSKSFIGVPPVGALGKPCDLKIQRSTIEVSGEVPMMNTTGARGLISAEDVDSWNTLTLSLLKDLS
jgi:hypothetical protein